MRVHTCCDVQGRAHVCAVAPLLRHLPVTRVLTYIAIKALCSGNFSAMCGLGLGLGLVRLLPRVTLVANTESNEEQRMTTLSSGFPCHPLAPHPLVPVACGRHNSVEHNDYYHQQEQQEQQQQAQAKGG